MDGYNKKLSKGIPTLRTTLDRTDEEKVYSVDFEDQENKQASWKASFNITKQDKGMQVYSFGVSKWQKKGVSIAFLLLAVTNSGS